MSIRIPYKTRPIRFIEVYSHTDWQIKIYSISAKNEYVDETIIELAKINLSKWLSNCQNYELETYKIATLILHQGKEGCFAVINWWIDENMLQNHVYLKRHGKDELFTLYSDKGIAFCIWELEVIWFERNAWIKHVLSKAPYPNFTDYLNEHLFKN